MGKIVKIIKEYAGPIAYDVFIASLLVYIASSLLETLKRGIVVDYFNIQHLLAVCLLSGVLAVVLPVHEVKMTAVKKWKYWIVAGLIIVLSTYYVWHYVAQTGQFAYVIASATAVTVFFAAYALIGNESLIEK